MKAFGYIERVCKAEFFCRGIDQVSNSGFPKRFRSVSKLGFYRRLGSGPSIFCGSYPNPIEFQGVGSALEFFWKDRSRYGFSGRSDHNLSVGSGSICFSQWLDPDPPGVLRRAALIKMLPETPGIMAFILDGCSEHVAHVWFKKCIFREKNRIWPLFRCNQMPSSNLNPLFTPYKRIVKWATI